MMVVQTWNLAPGSDGKARFGAPKGNNIHPDVHSIHVHPSDPDLVMAPTGGGLYLTQDGGTNWNLLYDCYCRALWWDPNDLNHIIFGPADGVGSRGRIEESHDGGQTWQNASEGLEIPWPNTMPERFTQIKDALFCILDDGRILTAQLHNLGWEFILEDIPAVNAISTANKGDES